ncbi:MAG: TolC family protein [Methylacidiphilales bacterium]|nr:TolC family protein [Candidatus Methylacidiphilales bacterium]NJR15223.1 TolC family protein [Calothrix sp. CSU_2_0]
MANIKQLLLLALFLNLNLTPEVTAQTKPLPVPVAPPVKSPVPVPVPPPEANSAPTPESTPVPENSDEFSTTEDQQQAEEQSDSVVPKTEQNPFVKPDIDKLIQQQFSEDMWRIMRGGLSCLETSATCLEQLQSKAVTQSPLLRELDTRIAEANEKINAAKAQNKKSIRLGVLTPALQYLLGPTVNPGQRQPAGTGLIDNIASVIRGDTSILNGLLRVIGIPLFEGSQGGNADAQRNAIAISDLQIKVAELQRGRAKLADEIREKVAAALIRFDEAKTSFQTSQVVASRAIDQFKVFELRYTRGNSDTESYLSRLNSLDNQKAQTYQDWAKMRRSLFELKLLVLSVKDAEI